ncbi:hypothetical protein FRX31_029709 [Thalictrum thalictroides]|uniref:Uncharacterized protein n=1 Tax=Thalictrum thalictroides TaxID=46969 RepID=A0A7J6V6G2_THATH|nr:hypothetical protein FRX31_029709 [Thalictrum thalictroides]
MLRRSKARINNSNLIGNPTLMHDTDLCLTKVSGVEVDARQNNGGSIKNSSLIVKEANKAHIVEDNLNKGVFSIEGNHGCEGNVAGTGNQIKKRFDALIELEGEGTNDKQEIELAATKVSVQVNNNGQANEKALNEVVPKALQDAEGSKTGGINDGRKKPGIDVSTKKAGIGTKNQVAASTSTLNDKKVTR